MTDLDYSNKDDRDLEEICSKNAPGCFHFDGKSKDRYCAASSELVRRKLERAERLAQVNSDNIERNIERSEKTKKRIGEEYDIDYDDDLETFLNNERYRIAWIGMKYERSKQKKEQQKEEYLGILDVISSLEKPIIALIFCGLVYWVFAYSNNAGLMLITYIFGPVALLWILDTP